MSLLRRREGTDTGWALQVSARTDRGRVRRENQDAVLGQTGTLRLRPDEVALVAVADGMGGGPAGALASREALRELASAFAQEEGDVPERLARSMARANRHVYGFVERNPGYAGMGTTVVAAAVGQGRAWVANVGDSRAYLLRNGRLERLTEDHSWVQEQVRAGIMSAREAARSPYRNVITRAVGSEPEVETDLFGPVDLAEGEILLLCSDGLHGLLEEREILAVARQTEFPRLADALVEAANEAGGSDNISVVAVQPAAGA
ncbi:MAG TPA: Stp1/IreP family PP2C-type Ser/Thr phosphatase [Dehalococcoidia bacterium]